GRRSATRSAGAGRGRLSASHLRSARSRARGPGGAGRRHAGAWRARSPRGIRRGRTAPCDVRGRRSRSHRGVAELLSHGRGARARTRPRSGRAASSHQGHAHSVRRRALLRCVAGASALAMIGVVGGCDDTRRSGKVHVEFWTMSLKPKFIAYFEARIAQYQAAHPHVELEWVDVPWDALQTKLTAAIVAGSAPALVQLNVPWAYDYALYGALRPIDDLMGDDRNRYTAGAIADVTFNGRLYGFPHYSSVNVMAYNRALFQQAGVTRIPATRDEQLAVAKAIKARTGQYGFSPALGKIAGVFLEEGLPLVQNGRAVFNSPAHVALIAKLRDAYQAGGLLKDKLFSEDNYPASIDAYKSGRMAMLEAPPSALTRVRDDAPDIYAVTDVAPVPIGAPGVVAGGWLFHFAMPKGT